MPALTSIGNGASTRGAEVEREISTVASGCDRATRLWLAIAGLAVSLALQAACLVMLASRPPAAFWTQTSTLVRPTEVDR